MTDDPFNPPSAKVDDPVAKTQPYGSVWKGVLIGGAIDLGGSTALGFIIVIVYIVLNIDSSTGLSEIMGLLMNFVEESLSFDSAWGLAGVILGSIISLIAGYVCALFAREFWIKAALILGAIDALYVLANGQGFYSIETNLGYGLLTFTLVFIGGWIRVLQQQKLGRNKATD